jgi:hypothetical protein
VACSTPATSLLNKPANGMGASPSARRASRHGNPLS